MELNYLVKTDNYFSPLPKGITEENLIQFLNLYLKQKSGFSSWLDKNVKNMNFIMNNKIEPYLEKPIDKMNKLNKMIDYLIESELKTKVKRRFDNLQVIGRTSIKVGGKQKRGSKNQKGGGGKILGKLLAKTAMNYLFNRKLKVKVKSKFDKFRLLQIYS